VGAPFFGKLGRLTPENSRLTADAKLRFLFTQPKGNQIGETVMRLSHATRVLLAFITLFAMRPALLPAAPGGIHVSIYHDEWHLDDFLPGTGRSTIDYLDLWDYATGWTQTETDTSTWFGENIPPDPYRTKVEISYQWSPDTNNPSTLLLGTGLQKDYYSDGGITNWNFANVPPPSFNAWRYANYVENWDDGTNGYDHYTVNTYTKRSPWTPAATTPPRRTSGRFPPASRPETRTAPTVCWTPRPSRWPAPPWTPTALCISSWPTPPRWM